ncbi:MDR family MFS transporter [Nocardioides coralli]|uniref:MDR family MFS transporter n=1 Tax=Nocardioides coralli TaxID=2872154 RepID=UPI001CA392BA|nr:MDR family MFS transporter [Nocardioides coralli]QZY28423.1 multidrug efflux MFS transporter [Nocardioides coralli]
MSESTATPVVERTNESPYAVLRWLVLATFVVILNETIMVNAIPRLMQELEVTARSAQWLSTAFMLTMAVVIPVTGWFLQRVTTRQAFTTAMTVFLAGTLLSALAPVFWLLVMGRIVQAAGTAVMLPLLMTTLMTIVPEHDRGRVMGNVTLAISVAPALGPAVSGVVLQLASWRWLFGLVLPVAGLVTVLALRKLTDVGETRPSRLDVPSIGLAALGFGTLVYGLSRIGAAEGSGVPALALVGAGLVVVAAFLLRQRALQRRDMPLLDLRVLSHRTYAVGVTVQSVSFLAMLGAMILLPLYLQDLRGLTPLETGLLVAPGGLAMGLLGPRVGRAFDRVGAKPLVVPGAIGLVIGLGMLSRVGETTPYAVVLAGHVVMMVSLAALFTPVFTISLGALPPHLYSHGSSLLGTSQQVAAAIGTAVSVTVLASRSNALLDAGASESAAFVGGVQWAFGAAALISLSVVALVFLLPSRVPGAGPAPVEEVDPTGEPDPVGC